jgi:methylated-DNA-[protein]-cysteine S-methyltransferase
VQVIATTVLERAPWRLRLARSWRGLCYLSLDADDIGSLSAHVSRHFRDAAVADDPAALAAEAGQIAEYLSGTRRHIDVDLDLRGTSFQVRVWRALLAVPYGTTITYGEVARVIGRPGGAHAVGQAVGHNPVGIVVPCHRVVASGGRLGGYGGSLEPKRRLLALEGVPPLRE